MHVPLFYRQKPVFAIDIGQSTVKVAQLGYAKNRFHVVGYGYADFNPEAIEDGVITKPEALTKPLKPLLKKIVIGELTTDRVVTSLPTDHIFTRVVNLPDMEESDLESAVRLEAEQYVPLPPEEIYIDYTVIKPPTKEDPETMAMLVAAPKNLVDSYMKLFNKLGLEIEAIEPSIFSIMRAVNHANDSNNPKVVIDFGSESSDLAIYDQSVQLTSTIATGGTQITQKIAETLEVDHQKAEDIKSRYGIGKSKWQDKLAPALSPILSTLADEVQKMLRYHHNHSKFDEPISEISIVGGGANMPGLSDFLTHLTGIEVDICDPWRNIDVKPLQPPHHLETTLYTTAVGLALKEGIND